MADSTLRSPIQWVIDKLVTTLRSATSALSPLPSVSTSSRLEPCHTVMEDLKKLKRILEGIQATLEDAEEREIGDKSVKLWLKELKDVAYDADDVLEEYQYELLRSEVEDRGVTKETTRKRKREEGRQSATSHLHKLSNWNVMTDKIKKIRETFYEIAKNRDSLGLRESDGVRRSANTTNPPPTSSLVNELDVYGMKDMKNRVIQLLLSKKKCSGDNISVLTIIGMGGIGKTTLAQLVYNDPSIHQYYDKKVWVYVSEDFDVTRLTRTIIESITKAKCSLQDLSPLQEKLKEELLQRKVLIVLDDIWNEKRSLWDLLRAPFTGTITSTIIVTTRNESVAKIMQTMPSIHIDLLPIDQCLLLFHQHAFGDLDTNAHKNLLEIGEKIVKKCGRLPLAVKTLGSLLRYETDEEAWRDILESNLWELGESEDEIIPALRLSYDRMPAYLKPCFVYCSLFTKGYGFSEKVMVRLWMSQGFIQPSGRRSLEDTGKKYFVELRNRSFFQGLQGNIVMHDLIHDLAQSISRKEVCITECKACNEIFTETRHLTVTYVYANGEDMQLASFNNLGALRTCRFQISKYVYCPGTVNGSLRLNVKMLNDMFLNLGRLRTLDLHYTRIEELPDSIGNLKYLRYLDLSTRPVERVPESICQLYNLQTLYLPLCIRQLPRGIVRLSNLRHLPLPRFFTSTPPGIRGRASLQELFFIMESDTPPGIGQLTNLQELVFMVENDNRHYDGLGELKDLVNLRQLEILELSAVVNVQDAKDASLKDKEHLQNLELSWCKKSVVLRKVTMDKQCKDDGGKLDREELEEGVLESLRPHTNLTSLSIFGYNGVKFPNWISDPSFSNLVSVKVSHIGWRCKFLPPFGQLPSLKQLEIENMHGIQSMGREFYCFDENAAIKRFPLLSELVIQEMPELEHWEVLDGEFPHLRSLRVNRCPELTSVVGLQNLTALQRLEVHTCYKLCLDEQQLSCMPQLKQGWCEIEKNIPFYPS